MLTDRFDVADFQISSDFRKRAEIYYEGPPWDPTNGNDNDFNSPHVGEIYVAVNRMTWAVARVCSSGRYYAIGSPHACTIREMPPPRARVDLSVLVR